MAFSLAIDEVVDCAFIKWAGLFSADEHRMYLERTLGNKAFHGCSKRLHDAREAMFNVPPRDIRSAARNSRLAAGSRAPVLSATLVSSDLGFGVMRMLGALYASPEIEMAVFRELDKAKEWLGLPPDYNDPFPGMPDPDQAV